MSPRLKALSVHLLTASGAVLSMFAMLAAVEEDWSMMFLWLVLALIVVGIDGPLARRALYQDVAERLLESGAGKDLRREVYLSALFSQLDEVQRLAANLRHGQAADQLTVLTVFALSRDVLPRADRRPAALTPCRRPS